MDYNYEWIELDSQAYDTGTYAEMMVVQEPQQIVVMPHDVVLTIKNR